MWFGNEIAPRGYIWIFPKGEDLANVGIGVAMTEKPAKYYLDKFIEDNPEIFSGASIIEVNSGGIPVGGFLKNMVMNGLVVVGDAACNVNPIHGGGIGPSMMAGKIAGEVIAEALSKGEPTMEALWPINVRYMSEYGAKQAGLDIFRIFLQSLTNEDINYGMKYRLIKEEDVLKASMEGRIHLNVTDVTRRVIIGLGRMRFLGKLYEMARKSRRVRELYANYPKTPKDFPQWRQMVQEVFAS